jgi:hypothetical protein
LGPGPIDAHLQHAEGFATVVEHVLGHVPSSLADLGSGAGIPGLVLAARWPGCATTLIESNHRRATHLRTAAAEPGWSGRVEVIEDRAELVARRAECRERFAVVTARSFAGPAATPVESRCGLVGPPEEWKPSGMPGAGPAALGGREAPELGFGAAGRHVASGAHFVVLQKEHEALTTYRGVGRPTNAAVGEVSRGTHRERLRRRDTIVTMRDASFRRQFCRARNSGRSTAEAKIHGIR